MNFDGKVYIIENFITKEVYVGQTTRIGKALEWYYGSGDRIRRAIKKYGLSNFRKTILRQNIGCQSALDLYEILYIKKYDCISPKGYNLDNGGRHGARFTAETRRKISKGNKGKPSAFKGRHHTEEAKERNRQAHLGKKSSLRQREVARQLTIIRNKGNKYNQGKHLSQETKDKIASSILGRKHSEESKAKMRAAKANRLKHK